MPSVGSELSSTQLVRLVRTRPRPSLLAVEPGDRAVPGQFRPRIVGGHLGRGPATGDLDGGDAGARGHQVPRHADARRVPREAAGPRIARRAVAAAVPTYRVAPLPSWSLFERRTVTLADPSLRNSTSAQVSAAASERRSMASRMTEMSATSTRPRRRAVRAPSVRPPGPVRRRWAVARIASSALAVRAAACLGVRPSCAARRVSPRITRRTLRRARRNAFVPDRRLTVSSRSLRAETRQSGVQAPNPATVRAMKHLDEGRGQRCDSAEELFRDLDI